MLIVIFFCIFVPKILPMYKNNRKELLFKAAFKQFVTKQFDGVSISDIEEESGLTRGAVFYYSKSKLDLYKQAVAHYIVNAQDPRQKISAIEGCTLLEYINHYVESVEATMNGLIDILALPTKDHASRSYISSMLQVCTLFPDLKEQYQRNIHNDIARWVSVISSAIARGEVRDDIDVLNMARQFVYTFYGSSLSESFIQGLNTLQLREQMLLLYNLIKKS